MTDAADAPLAPRVVLIEDDPLVLFGQEMLLKDWGYRVVTGRSREAINKALESAPEDVAAIIADFNLGGSETGADVARAVARNASPEEMRGAEHRLTVGVATCGGFGPPGRRGAARPGAGRRRSA